MLYIYIKHLRVFSILSANVACSGKVLIVINTKKYHLPTLSAGGIKKIREKQRPASLGNRNLLVV